MSARHILVDGLVLLLQVNLTLLDHVFVFIAQAYNLILKSSQTRSSQSSKKTVVIVGANFSGLAALWELLKHTDCFRVVLIDQKDYFEYTPGVLRLFCYPGHFKNVAQKLPGDCDNAADATFQRIQGKVTSVANQQGEKILSYVHQNKTETLSYDYIILATGSTYNYPITASSNELSWKARQLGWEAAHRRLEAASTVLILGGGAVGVELAAEIVECFPKKQVTLMDVSPVLVPLFDKAVGEYAARWLTQHGVRLVLGQILESWDETSCKIRNGTVLRADIVYICFGDRPNSQCASTPTASSAVVPFNPQLDRRKCLVVSNMLQLSTANINGRVFACGDVATPPTEGNKQAFHAEIQGHLAAQNVVRMNGQHKLLRYPDDIAGASQMPLIFILSLGKYDGVLGFNQLIIHGPITAVLKWGLEFTKVIQMNGRPLGKLIWSLAEEVVLFLSRTLIKPFASPAHITKAKVG